MERVSTDVLVIGAGSGGLSVAAGAVQMGARVVLLEAGKMGGDCLNYGCVPSKALIAAGAQADVVRNARFGVAPLVPQIDFGAVKDQLAQTIRTIEPHDSQERFEGLGVQVIREFGRFMSPREVQAGDTVIEARRIVIATGSAPLVPPIPGLSEVPFLTNETVFELRERPDHLLIIGGGPIGMEMAQAHVRLGSKVTVIEGLSVLHHEDPEATALVCERLRADGVEIIENAMAEAISEANGEVVVSTSHGTFSGSHLLVAVGRTVRLEGLDLDKGNVAHDCAVLVDASLRSISNRRVYAIGDAAGGPQFTHVAGYHAGVIIRSMLLGLRSRARTNHIPRVTYTDPELAQIGPTEAEARAAHGDALSITRVEYSGNDRAVIKGATTGFVKIMVVRGRPIGATIVGSAAGELIGLWALAIANRLKMSAIAAMVAPYPTLGEISKRAAGAYFSPKLFDNPMLKRIVGLVQRYLP